MGSLKLSQLSDVGLVSLVPAQQYLKRWSASLTKIYHGRSLKRTKQTAELIRVRDDLGPEACGLS